MKKYIYLCAALLLAACSEKKENTESGDVLPSDTAHVSTKEAAESDTISKETVDAVTSATNVANSPTFNGIMMVTPQKKATLSLTMGGKIHSLSVMPGQYIAKGQTVATIDNPEFIELQQIFLEASAQTEYLAQEYQRQTTLGNHDAASKKKVQQSKAEYLSMKSRLAAATARLKTLGINIATIREKGIMTYLPVSAPFSGYVTNIDVNVGKYLETGQPICDIINKSNPLLQLTVYEKDLPVMRVGRKALFRVNGLGKTSFEAVIVSIDQSIDEKDYSIKVYAQVKSDRSEFRPGMYVRAKLVDEK